MKHPISTCYHFRCILNHKISSLLLYYYNFQHTVYTKLKYPLEINKFPCMSHPLENDYAYLN